MKKKTKTWLLLNRVNIVTDRRTTTIKLGSACCRIWTVLHWREPMHSSLTKVQLDHTFHESDLFLVRHNNIFVFCRHGLSGKQLRRGAHQVMRV